MLPSNAIPLAHALAESGAIASSYRAVNLWALKKAGFIDKLSRESTATFSHRKGK